MNRFAAPSQRISYSYLAESKFGKFPEDTAKRTEAPQTASFGKLSTTLRGRGFGTFFREIEYAINCSSLIWKQKRQLDLLIKS